MTAINVFVRPDKAFLMTDGAVYLPSGVIVGFGSKAMPIPNLNAAIAVRGLQGVATSFAFEFSIRYSDFDDMVDRLQDDLAEWHEQRVMQISSDGWQDADIYVVGWSAKDQRMKAFNFTTREEPGATYALAQVEEIEGFSVAPSLSDEEWFVNLRSLGADMVGPEAVRRFDPIRHGIPIMQAQRRVMVTDVSDVCTEALSIVGGHITLTEIDRHGISQRIVHRWNDDAGEPIVPEPFVHASKPSGPVPSNMNRQQRKRFEAMQRKGQVA